MSCTIKDIRRIAIVTPDRGTQPRAVCSEHRALLAEAARAGLPLMVTPTSVYGGATVAGGTIWIMTLGNLWWGPKGRIA